MKPTEKLEAKDEKPEVEELQVDTNPKKAGYILPKPKKMDGWQHDEDTVTRLLKYWRPDDSKFNVALKDEIKAKPLSSTAHYLSFEHDGGGSSNWG